MKNITDLNLVRQYLLGRLDEQADLEDNVSDGILFNDEMTDIVDSIEDEIIEEYLEGSLSSVDREAVDKYFLQPPERQEKLRFAKLLKHHFETKPSRYSGTKHENFVRVPVPWLSHFRTYGQFAALVLLIFSTLIYVNGVRRSQGRLESELVQERERSSNLVKEAELLQPSMVPLTLVADRSRGAEIPIPQVKIKSSTRRIIVEIALQGGPSGPYDVRLETKEGKGPLWSARLSPLISSSGDARLLFDLPSRGIESDVYSLVVSSPTGALRRYDFQAKLAK